MIIIIIIYIIIMIMDSSFMNHNVRLVAMLVPYFLD